MKRLWKKYREVIMYLIFGVLTTIVGFGTYFLLLALCERVFAIAPGSGAYNVARLIAQILQWVLAVLFAYFTNKWFVFQAKGGNEAKQVSAFFAARLFSLGADSAVTFGTIGLLALFEYRAFTWELSPLPISLTFSPDLWGKLVAAVVVIILNYVLSKFFVFKSTRG